MPNPNNQTPGLPSSPLQVELWKSAQIQSQAYSDQTDFMFQLQQPADGVYQLGKGSQGPGTFTTNGKLPNDGNNP